MEKQNCKGLVLRTLKDISLEELLSSINQTAMAAAAQHVKGTIQGIDGDPTSIRLSDRTLKFYDALASGLYVSRNSVLKMILEHLAAQALQEEIET